MLQIELIVDREQLHSLRDRWRELAGRNLFQWPEWLFPWWDAYGQPHDLFVVVVRDPSNGIRAIAPWYRERTFGGGRTIRFLGSGKACSEYLTLLADEDDWAEPVEAIAQWLAKNHPSAASSWDQLELQGAAADDEKLAALAASLETADSHVVQRPGPGCWRLALPGTWDELLQPLGSSTRRKVRRLLKSPQTEQGTFEWHSSAAGTDWATLYTRLEELHQKRWKAANVDGCFSCPRFRQFLQQAARELAERGNAWISSLSHGGDTVAATLILRHEQQHYLYLCGVDPALGEHEPGWRLNIATLQHLVDTSAEFLDFLRGNERYKTDLRSTFIRQTDWRISAPHSVGRLRHQMWVTHHWLRELGKQWLRPTSDAAAADD